MCAAAIALVGVGLSVGAGAALPEPDFLVAVGGSGSVGFQPTLARPHGQATDSGYANDLLAAERSRWSDLRLLQFGCPGATTVTMLTGGGHCRYTSGSQLADVVSFLHEHPSAVLITVDLGFNDVRPCLAHHSVDEACVDRALGSLHDQLPPIIAALRAAGGPSMEMVGVGHYDPYLADYLHGAAGQSFAAESVTVISRLNDVLHAVYTTAGVPMADVAGSFQMTSDEPTLLPGFGLVPQDVAQTCTLTWMCTSAPLGPNPHPNDAGYRVISDAIRAVVPNP